MARTAQEFLTIGGSSTSTGGSSTGALDETVAECVKDGADDGITRDALERAAGGDLRTYVKEAIRKAGGGDE